LLAVLVAVLALSVYADAAGADKDLAIGKVQGLYVKQADHLYVQARAADIRAGKELWADVHFESPARNAIAFVPSDLSVERGDLVELHLAQRTMEWRIAMLPVSEVNRVIAINAKHDSFAAILYGARREPAF
jgi:hypothetical protein